MLIEHGVSVQPVAFLPPPNASASMAAASQADPDAALTRLAEAWSDMDRRTEGLKEDCDLDAAIDELAAVEAAMVATGSRSVVGAAAKGRVLISLIKEENKSGLDDIGSMAFSLAEDVVRLGQMPPPDAEIERLWSEWVRVSEAIRDLPDNGSRDRESDALCARLDALEKALAAAPPSSAKAAAVILTEMSYCVFQDEVPAKAECGADDIWMVYRTLETLRPQLTGTLAAGVDSIIQHLDRPIRFREDALVVLMDASVGLAGKSMAARL